MARNSLGVGPADHLKPNIELSICITCGMPAKWRFDRKQHRPYHYCNYCGIRVFIYHVESLIGFEMLHQLILKGAPAFRRTLRERVNRRMQVIARVEDDKRRRALRPQREKKKREGPRRIYNP